MSNSPSDRERLQRLREKQIGARDPLAKRRKVDAKVAARRRVTVKRFSVRDLTQIPHKYVWALIGAILGVLVVIFLPHFWPDPRAILVALVALLFLVALGFMLGRAMDTRDELKDLTD
jgi:VIT1/CCC1 family predicted Fe2+/Mn2+ transporter